MKKLVTIIFLIPFCINAQTAFISGNDTICDNEGFVNILVSFNNGTSPFTFVYALNGQNQPSITTTINPYLISTKKEGTYTLKSFSDASGAGTTSGSAILTVNPAPIAIINTANDTIKSIYPILQFNSFSEGNIISQYWNYGDNTMSESIDNPIHTFPRDTSGVGIPSTYQVSLIVIDDNSCSDTTYKNIFVISDFWFYIPNSFTPDNDQINDKFCIQYNGIRESTFTFYVINRQGEIVFETNNPQSLNCSLNNGWDGKDINNKNLMSATYVYELYFQDFEGWKHTKHGTINLVR